MSVPQDRRPLRWPLLFVGLVVLAATALGARQIVLALGGEAPRDPVAGAVTTTSSTTPPSGEAETMAATTSSTVRSTSTTGHLLADPDVSPGDESQPPDDVELTVGEPTVVPLDHPSSPNTISIQAGVVPPLVVAGESDPEGAGGRLVIEIPPTGTQQAPIPRGFGVGATVETKGHLAKFTVGVSTEGEGLDALTLDFGDGTDVVFSSAQRGELIEGGTVDVSHRYEPTLTVQPWTATVRGVSGDGVVRQSSLSLETQAQFLLSYSALSVTALRDCDLFGKGDFILEWNNDGRDRRSSFDLGKGETYVEEDFRVGLNGVVYDQPIPLELVISESDSLVVSVAKFEFFYQLITGDGPLAARPPELFTEVIELGSHSYPVSVKVNAVGNCDTQIEFTTTLVLDESLPRS